MDELEDRVREAMDEGKLEQTLEKIVDNKVEEKLQQREQEDEEQEENQKPDISRRSFIKKLGLGAAGLGAATLIPSASALDIRDSQGLSVYSGGTEYLDASGDPVSVTNSDFNIPNGTLKVSTSHPRTEIRSNNPGVLWTRSSDGAVNASVQYDDSGPSINYLSRQDHVFGGGSGTGIGTEYFRINNGSSLVEVKNSDLDLDQRLRVGQNIEIKQGTSGPQKNGNPNIFNTDGSGTIQGGQADWLVFESNSSSPRGFSFYDSYNNQRILDIYDGGPVQLTNANLDVGSNKVTTNNFEITENSSTNSLDFNYTG